jgi:hypothetical protein
MTPAAEIFSKKRRQRGADLATLSRPAEEPPETNVAAPSHPNIM